MRRALAAARWLAILAILAAAGWFIVVLAAAGLPRVDALARRAPTETALMRQRRAEARKAGRPYRIDQRWVPYQQISPLLRRAVLIAEDDAFFSHGGLDWHEIGAAARRNLEKRRVVRGGSTITQQLAKNLYLAEERSLTRKIREVLLALRLEGVLSKRRIFELYLNLIEWGDGIYGAEAAAWRYFGVPASQLDARQAALLAAVIINPRRYSPASPARRIEKRMRTILTRMYRRGVLSEEQFRAALGYAPSPGQPGWLFGDSTRTRTGATPSAEPPPDSLDLEPDTTLAPR